MINTKGKDKINDVQRLLTERLRNFCDDARIIIEIEQQENLKLDEYKKLEIILKALKDESSEMILESVRSSSLGNHDKILLNLLYGNPRVAILLPSTGTTGEGTSSDELIPGDKQLIQQSLPKWPQDDVNVAEED